MKKDPKLVLTCFGAPQVTLDGGQVDIKRRKSLALVIYLAITRRSYTREALATLFWPDTSPERAFANLRQSLWEVNQTLGTGWLQSERDTLGLDLSRPIRVDVSEFRERLIDTRQAGLELSSRLPLLEQAVQLYQGNFLSGFNLKDAPGFDEWVFFESESLLGDFKGLLESLVNLLVNAGRASEAIPYARRRLALDQLDEAAHRQLIAAYAQAGQPNAALRQYQECARILQDELGVEPGAETQALYEQLQSRDLPEATSILVPTPGLVLKKRYQFEAEIGLGSMGSVFRAHDARLDRKVAIKILNASASSVESHNRLLNEARISARLNHPNIVSVYDADEAQGLAFIVMEYVVGQNLREAAPDSQEEILQIVGQICTALAYAHTQGVIHRDLKPENIMLTSGMVKLMDFGLARSIREDRPSDSKVLVGTPVYMAPELLAGKPADQRSDLYALGVILYELVAGQLPFQGESLTEVFSQHLNHSPLAPSHHRPGITPALEAIILKLLAKKPDERYQSAAEVQLALSELRKPELTITMPPHAQHNLPALLTHFIGRRKERSDLQQMLSPSVGENHHSRLVTLIGPGGTGKTRLSVETAFDLLDVFPEGIWLIELATLADPTLIPQTVAVTFGLPEDTQRPILDTLIDYLRPRTTLLILDNCEHLIEACAQFAETLLQRCPELRLLASSREALGVPGERILRVPPLSFPPPRTSINDQADWLQFESILLFLDRASIARPDFSLQNANAAAIAQICARLDGIPLAIELAAARVSAMTVEQILQRLDNRFRLLTGGSRTALPRHQTLRALIDWSYELLSPAEQALLRRLAVFSGGWTLEAAENILAGWAEENWPEVPAPPASLLDGLSLLINKSLVIAEQKEKEGMRYRMLETIRQYGREKLIQAGEVNIVHERHLAYFIELGHQAEQGIAGPQAAYWIKRLTSETDNARTALSWALESDVVSGLKLAGTVLSNWWVNSTASEGIENLTKLLAAQADPAPSLPRARALLALSNIDPGRGHALQAAEAALNMFRALNDANGIAQALLALGTVECLLDNFYKGRACFAESLEWSRQTGNRLDEAAALACLGLFSNDKTNPLVYENFQAGLAIFRELGDLLDMTWVLRELANLDIYNGNFYAAQTRNTEAMEILHQLDLPDPERFAYETWGRLAYHQGDYEKARLYFQACASMHEQRGQYFLKSWINVRLGLITLWQGNLQDARALFLESLVSFQKIGSTDGIIYTLECMAHLAATEGKYAHAATLVAWADATRLEIGDKRPPVEQAEIDRSLAPVWSHMEDASLEEAIALGKAMDLEEATQYAINTNDN